VRIQQEIENTWYFVFITIKINNLMLTVPTYFGCAIDGTRKLRDSDRTDTDCTSSRKFSRNDTPTATVFLAGTQLSSSIYGDVFFELTFFNEVTKSDNILRNIRAHAWAAIEYMVMYSIAALK
jgi:hypothetical protein